MFSALGLLFSEIEHEFVRSAVPSARASSTRTTISDAFRSLAEEALDRAREEGDRAGVGDLRSGFAELRYAGQAYELTVRVPTGRIASTS